MPFNLDTFATTLAQGENPASDVSPQLPPQADQDAIQRKLLGDDLVDRYGDVLGSRPRTMTDRLRDFTISMSEGPKAVRDLQFKVLDTYQKQYQTAVRTGISQRQQEIAQINTIFRAIEAGRKNPGYGAQILTSTLKSLGITPDPAVVKMMTDEDVLAKIQIQKLSDAAQQIDGPELSEILGLFTDPVAAGEFLADAKKRKLDEARVGKEAASTAYKTLQTQKLRTELDALPFEQAAKRAAEKRASRESHSKLATEKARRSKLRTGGASGNSILSQGRAESAGTVPGSIIHSITQVE